MQGGGECQKWQDILYLSLSLSHVLVTVKGTVGNGINCILGFVLFVSLGICRVVLTKWLFYFVCFKPVPFSLTFSESDNN